MTIITKRQPIVSILLPSDIQLAGLIQLATALYCRAHRDARSRNASAGRVRASALSFLANDPLAQSMAEVFDCENDSAIEGHERNEKEAGYEIERKYFIEINDPRAGGRRGLTDARPVIVYGYIQPLKRNRRGIANVIIVEEPADFAETWRALPTDEWVALDGYSGPAGAVSESEYARLLARVPGIQAQHISTARRRAMDDKEQGRE